MNFISLEKLKTYILPYYFGGMCVLLTREMYLLEWYMILKIELFIEFQIHTGYIFVEIFFLIWNVIILVLFYPVLYLLPGIGFSFNF